MVVTHGFDELGKCHVVSNFTISPKGPSQILVVYEELRSSLALAVKLGPAAVQQAQEGVLERLAAAIGGGAPVRSSVVVQASVRSKSVAPASTQAALLLGSNRTWGSKSVPAVKSPRATVDSSSPSSPPPAKALPQLPQSNSPRSNSPRSSPRASPRTSASPRSPPGSRRTSERERESPRGPMVAGHRAAHHALVASAVATLFRACCF